MVLSAGSNRRFLRYSNQQQNKIRRNITSHTRLEAKNHKQTNIHLPDRKQNTTKKLQAVERKRFPRTSCRCKRNPDNPNLNPGDASTGGAR